MLPADASGTELLGEPGASILTAQHAEIAASRPKSFFAHIKDCLPLKTSTVTRSLPPMNDVERVCAHAGKRARVFLCLSQAVAGAATSSLRMG